MRIDVVIGEDEFSKNLAERLQAKFINFKTHTFPDSEIKPTLETEANIKRNNVLLVLRAARENPSINDEIMKIFFLTSLLRELEASEISLFIPYMFYARQDKQFLPGEPKSLQNMAEFYERLLIKNIFTINSHVYGKEENLQSFFKNIKIHDVNCVKLFSDYLKTKNLTNPIVIGPDAGSKRMIKEMADLVNASYECLEKERNHVTSEVIAKPPKADLKDRDVIIYDDVAASGGTIVRTFEIASVLKPKRIFVALTHLMTREGVERLCKLKCTELITTDSFKTEELKKYAELSLIPLVSEYIKNHPANKI